MTMFSRDLTVPDVPLWALRFKLTKEQAAFVDGYLEHFDPVRAFREAGFTGRDAQKLAVKLLTTRKIQAALRSRNEDLHDRSGDMRQEVLRGLKQMLDADLSDIFDNQDRPRPVAEWPAAWRSGLVRSMTVKHRKDREGPYIVFRMKIADRLKLLELLMRHLGMLGPHHKRKQDKEIVAAARAAMRHDERRQPWAP